ncbi:MAG: DUF302 domain-containing protein [Deltaproteobacteria bacterium]|nr:DUF302 domain-containing protein [Deltaproteobacteria bacterium]
MKIKKYAISKKFDAPYDEVVLRVREALPTEGFGVLTEIDVKATLKKKLDKDFRNYIILGACNPTYAHMALSTEVEIGILLPCNVIVYDNDEGGVTVSAMDPTVALEVTDNKAIEPIAKEVKEKLERILERV